MSIFPPSPQAIYFKKSPAHCYTQKFVNLLSPQTNKKALKKGM
nr:MAG TPA: hypothetical protein [Crassvirales sp.]